ncbi:MAG: NADH-quinone oxidoreductase subunit J [Gammaproteobacteria bacterium]|nr:NADH-quinone oxidoreductase subunit J [Gammaproteobacteria bacterium]
MSFVQVIFYLFAVMMLVAALRVITVRNPVHAALFLVLTFICTSVLWLMLEAEFLAIVLVLVYVGAVMVLFLFVVMLLNINIESLREGFVQYVPVGILIALALFVQMIIIVGPNHFGLQDSVLTIGPNYFAQKNFAYPAPAAAEYSNTEMLGRAIFTDYLYPFEIAAVILLVAIIAAISLALRKRTDTKRQNPAQQIQVRKQDRLRIVKMEAEE